MWLLPQDKDGSDSSVQETKIRGIVLTDGDSKELNRSDVTGIKISDLKIPGKESALKKRLSPYLGSPLNTEVLRDIKRTIVDYYAEHDCCIVKVTIPPQDVSKGVIRVKVTEGKVGALTFTGNRWFTNEQLGRYLDIRNQQTISQEALLNDVSWMNRNPFHYSELVLSPGSEPGTTNIELLTSDRRSWRVYTGADNTGNLFTGTPRYYAGFNSGNVFNRGDVFTYQFTFDPARFRQFWSNYGNYTIFLPWKHVLMAFGGFGTTKPNIQDFSNTGNYGQASVRYTFPIKPLYCPLVQEVNVGFDYKYLNSNLFFDSTGVPVVAGAINVGQWTVGYSLNRIWAKNDVKFSAELYFSPFQFMANQNSAAYGAIRPHAKSIYAYGRVTLNDVWTLPGNWSCSALLRGQYATCALLPSEEFGLGGYNTVRGYNERVFNVDNVFCANLEIRTPPVSLFKRAKNSLLFLAFLDYGIGHYLHPMEGQPGTQYLLGIGPGVRYNIEQYLSLRADYGFALKHIEGISKKLGEFHLGGVLSY
jgi:hemolysin activation/secretion protein